jgi:hypothetical protein
MLVMGICNPAGENDAYNGLYLTQNELRNVVSNRSMLNLPVKTEHAGSTVGKVVSSFLDDSGRLQCVMHIETESLSADLVRGFIRKGIAADLSLGYTVDIRNHDQKLKAAEKKILEVSLVRKGARNGCHIIAYEDDRKNVVFRDINTWNEFDLT